MYDAPFDLLTSLGWLLAGIVLVLGAARAVRLESRFVRAGAAAGGRAADIALTVATALAVAGLVGVLAAVVVTGLR